MMIASELLLSKSSITAGTASAILKAITNTGGTVIGAAPLKYVFINPTAILEKEFDAEFALQDFESDNIVQDSMELDVIDGIMSADIEIVNKD